MDLKIVFDLLKEVREDQKQHGIELAKQSTYLEKMDSDVKDLKTTVFKNTEDIAHHIKRTDILEKLHKDNESKIEQDQKRLNALEEPVKAKAWIKKNFINLASLLTAFSSLLALITKLKGFW